MCMLVAGTLLAVWTVDFAMAKAPVKRAAAPTVPRTSPLEVDSAEAKALLAVLEKAEYKFTPEVKTAFLAWRKVNALAEIAKTGQRLPNDFLEWVDSDPVVAGTVYGLADNAAQRLVLLRSLEIDLGKEEVRQKHL